MTNFICTTCGVQYGASSKPPENCPICEDERQYVNWKGQQWTTLAELQAAHTNVFTEEEPGLISIATRPGFAIGQRALLVQTPSGNVLWDCISLIDEKTIAQVQSLGGISAIAVSHPHYYSSIVEWSRAFNDAPIYIHAGDRRWVMRTDAPIIFWQEQTRSLGDGLTLIHCGGHFAGSAVLHWQQGADGRGALLTGDTIKVAYDRRHVGFMYSFPNLIPLPEKAVRRILDVVMPWSFDRIYGAWTDHTITANGREAIRRSAERYIKMITS
jgi:hypothetical protein